MWHTKLTQNGGVGCLSTIDSVIPGLKTKTKTKKHMKTKTKMKRSSADNKVKSSELAKSEVVYCLPTTDVDAPAHELAKSRVVYCLPTTDVDSPTNAIGDQPIRQYLDMHVPRGEFPVPIAADSALAPRQPITGHHYNTQLEFPAITNASQRLTIFNNMTALSGIAPMHQESRHCHFGWQPSPSNEQHSAHLNPYEHKKSKAKYNSQELDVADSDIYSMWMACKDQEKP